MRPDPLSFRSLRRVAVTAVVGAALAVGVPSAAQAGPAAAPAAAAPRVVAPLSASPIPSSGPRLTRVVAFVRWAATQHIPYVYAGGHGAGPGPSMGGLDCSGLTRWAYAQVGWDLGSGSAESQRTSGKLVRTSNPVPGDLVYFANGGAAYHTGVYIGRDTDGTPQMVNAPYTGVDVRINRITKNVMGYYHSRYATPADSLPLDSPTPPPPPAKPAPPAPPRPLADGDFLRQPGTRWTFRMAGGAPVFVPSWAAYGGPQPTRFPTAAQWAALPTRPKDGTFLQDAVSHHVFRVTGGAPVVLLNWAAMGGHKPTVLLDPASLTRAGQAAPFNHLLPHPLDGTVLRSWPSGRYYRVAGGAPLPFAHAALVPAHTAINPIDEAAAIRAGEPGPLAFLNRYPADGTFIRGINKLRTYVVRGGRAVFIPSWAPFGGSKPFTFVDQTAIDWAGGPAPFNHLRK